MASPHNIILLVTDGHGHHTGDDDWGTQELRGLKSRMDRLQLGRRGFATFNNVVSPAVSTIMSIESILGGVYAARTHKMHWREWPAWDRLDAPLLGAFLKGRGYEVNGFSYLLNAENWMPGIHCYRPDLYRNFPSHKRDTHSHHAVLAAVRHFFANAFQPGRPHLLMVHTIFLFDLWDELMALFGKHGFSDDNTIYAFTSDHYFPRNFGRQWLLAERDRSPVFHHTDLTEHNTRVFLNLKYPGVKPQEIDQVVAGYDLTPTLLELAGLEREWPGRFDGRSLLPLLRGEPLPERCLRSDNVYPYQIGEKQGRITAIRSGRFKYVTRPDPASSYIAYRMHEPWTAALGREEFYDVMADPEEQDNLVAGPLAGEARAALEQCRAFLRTTDQDILGGHAEGLRRHAAATGLPGKLLSGTPSGRILLLQTCPTEVFHTLAHLVAGLLPQASLDLLVRDPGELPLPSGGRVIRHPRYQPFEPARLRELLAAAGAPGYDCVLRTSNIPVGDYAGVYDPGAHPVGDYAVAAAFLESLPAVVRGTLALDAALHPLVESGRGIVASGWNAGVVQPARSALAAVKPRLMQLVRSVEGSGPRIPPALGERIIRKERGD